MKQLVPTGIDEYLAEHKAGDLVSGRIVDLSGTSARVELGEGIQAACTIPATTAAPAAEQTSGKADLSSLGSMLQARWKGQSQSGAKKSEPIAAGQIRSFRITSLDPTAKRNSPRSDRITHIEQICGFDFQITNYPITRLNYCGWPHPSILLAWVGTPQKLTSFSFLCSVEDRHGNNTNYKRSPEDYPTARSFHLRSPLR